MRDGLEAINLSEERLVELGLPNFTGAVEGSCEDHEGGGSVFIQQWNGTAWDKISELIPPMNDIVRPMLEEAAEAYVSDKPDWQSQSCG